MAGPTAQTGRRPCGGGRSRRGGCVRAAGGKPADPERRCGPVPPDQSLARLAVSAHMDCPAGGSHRGPSPAGRRCRAVKEAPLGRCPSVRNPAQGLTGRRSQEGRAARSTPQRRSRMSSSWPVRGPRAELSLRPRHGDLCHCRAGGSLLQEPVENPALGPGYRGLRIARISRCTLSLGCRRGSGLGMFIGSTLNLLFGVPGPQALRPQRRACCRVHVNPHERSPGRIPAKPGTGRPCSPDITTAAMNAQPSGLIC